MFMVSAPVRYAAFAIALSMLAPADALAGKAGGNKRDPTFILRSSFSDSVKRFPGDQALNSGAARFEGPEQGAYIERCTWSLNNPLEDVLGLTQRCTRYTIENTQ